MHTETETMRHAQLFELLRQQNLSQSTSARLRVHQLAESERHRDEAASLLALAQSSWHPPQQEIGL